MAVFQELNRQGRTLVVVTHERDIAEFASRIITISDGKIHSDEPNPRVRSALDELEKLEEPVEVSS